MPLLLFPCFLVNLTSCVSTGGSAHAFLCMRERERERERERKKERKKENVRAFQM
jgi:hypothetical protein